MDVCSVFTKIDVKNCVFALQRAKAIVNQDGGCSAFRFCVCSIQLGFFSVRRTGIIVDAAVRFYDCGAVVKSLWRKLINGSGIQIYCKLMPL